MGMIGGPLAKRPLHFVWIVDCSGSMASDGKIQALNNAIREVIPDMASEADGNPQVDVLMRVLAFSDGARWIVSQPTEVHQFAWNDLSAAGVTDMGAALAMVSDILKVAPNGPMEQRALPPVLVLVSDGQPTDDFQAGLTRLLSEPWGKKAVRVAIGIGRDADMDVLERFIANPEIRPVLASSPEQLVRHVRWASTIAAQVSMPRQAQAGGPLPVPTPPSQQHPADLSTTW
jgi:uncharacterized protein YegL